MRASISSRKGISNFHLDLCKENAGSENVAKDATECNIE
jgi:hypothetical protein